ncbi:hypothetical protein PMG11_08502 [Penicillium brasilianum]|uniref:Uncharacterized protein n=1 Tax=Penicillium brasilianum TaxID=104259 RepID=A0A0F7TXU0_PENBI|nr:hypothetical protein PMG11_08502 [Penicillium brasilianum]
MTSYNQSQLSQYRFDFVVAVTQASINATMKAYLRTCPEPEIKVCYVVGHDPVTSQVVPEEIPYEKLLELTDNVDPFTVDIPSSNPETCPNFQKLLKAKFMTGFKVRMGIPVGADLATIPDIVGLRADTATVKYNLICSEFIVAALQNEWGTYSWLQKAQDPKKPWLYSATVDLRMGEVPDSAYSKLPQVVQDQIKNLSGSAFSIQQLLFDLSNAGLSSAPRIDGVDPGSALETILNRFFVSKYVANLRKMGDPMLGCAVVPKETDKSTLRLTDLNFSINPYIDPKTDDAVLPPGTPEQNLACLNYLCAVDNHVLPPPTRFPWNWLQGNENADHDGIVSINRNNLRDWLEPSLHKVVKKHCPKPKVYAKHHDGNLLKLYVEVYFGPDLEDPVVERKDNGQTVMTMSYEGYSEDDDQAGSIELKYKYTANVDFVGSNIIITQNVWVWYYAKAMSTSNHDVVVDDLQTDTYPITVSNGELIVGTADSKFEKRADPSDRNGFVGAFSGINRVTDSIQEQLTQLQSIKLETIPVSAMQGFVFPGGNTFTFKHAEFSEHQDLVAFIKYTS